MKMRHGRKERVGGHELPSKVPVGGLLNYFWIFSLEFLLRKMHPLSKLYLQF